MKNFKASQQAGYFIKKIQHEFRKVMDVSLSGLNLTTPQYALLAQLEESPGLSNSDLAKKSFISRQTMNLIVKNLDDRNLIQKEQNETHGRIINIRLTENGNKLLKEANILVEKMQHNFFKGLNSDELKDLTVLLRKLDGSLTI